MPFDNIVTRGNFAMPSVNKWGRENPDSINTPDDAEFIHPADVQTVQERGYWGTAVTDEDKSQYTVEGVTSANRESRLTGPGIEADGGSLDSVTPEQSNQSAEQAGETPRARRNKQQEENQ